MREKQLIENVMDKIHQLVRDKSFKGSEEIQQLVRGSTPKVCVRVCVHVLRRVRACVEFAVCSSIVV
jgi:hypothetical protein